MITEETLQAYEHDADEMQGRQPCGYLPDDIRELVTEVRRLNAAYERATRIFADSDADNAWWYELRLEEAFEPESEGK